MENELPDLGIELLKQRPKGTFLYFKNFLIGFVTFTNQEYISVTATVFLNIPTLATFDYSMLDFEKLVWGLPDTPTLLALKKKYKDLFSKSIDTVIAVNINDHLQSDGNVYLGGYLWDADIDGNNLPFAPFKSFELIKKFSPAFAHKSTRPLNMVAFDFLQCATIEKVNIPPMVPYLSSMLELTDINESFGLDSGDGIVLYFLEAIKKWKSPSIKALKAELKEMLKKYKAEQAK